jgi:F0F1-type ATP synthase membrane subunit b/b'
MKSSKGVTLLEYLAVLAFVLLFAVVIWPPPKEKMIDCRIAEISPDIPVKAKEECRKLNVQRN